MTKRLVKCPHCQRIMVTEKTKDIQCRGTPKRGCGKRFDKK